MLLNIVFIFSGFLTAVILARIIIPRILIISLRKRLFDTPDIRKVHKKPVSRLGGVSFFPAILFTVTFLIGVCDKTAWIPLVDIARHWIQILFLSSGLTLLFIIGIADDLIGVRYRQKWHYKIFCVNGNTGFRNESRIFYFIHLQNEEAYERKESSSA